MDHRTLRQSTVTSADVGRHRAAATRAAAGLPLLSEDRDEEALLALGRQRAARRCHDIFAAGGALQSVSFPGRGVGTVVRIVQTEIGPSIAGKIPPSQITKGVPGAYRTDPPVSWWPPTRTCGKQVLDPVRGYVLPPRGIARVRVVLQAIRPGRYRFGHVLHYTQSGRQYQEVIQEVVHGHVASHAPYIPVDSTEKTCLKRTKTRLLPYP
jgi:hypothetical protein